MLIILPWLSGLLIYTGLLKAWPRFSDSVTSKREIFLLASLIWGLLVVLITESLNVYSAITAPFLAGLWGAVLITAIGLGGLSSFFRFKIFSPPFKFSKADFPLYLYLSGIILITALIAFVVPPNEYDSMSYHMSRIMHWVQNRSVEFYPTHTIKQLLMPPWAEYAMLHFYLLSGSDFFSNFVQWYSFIGCLVAVSLIARQLGADSQGEKWAVVFCATLPAVIAQASNTKNDLVFSFWLAVFIYYLLKFTENPRRLNGYCAGVSLGLALLTKGTASIYVLPFVVMFLGFSVKRERVKSWFYFTGVLLIALLINSAFYLRGFEVFGKPIGVERHWINEIFTPAAIFSNLIRNVAVHLTTPSVLLNEILAKGIEIFHDKVLGYSFSNPATTLTKLPFHIPTAWQDESSVGNPMHFALGVISLFLLSRQPKRPPGFLLIYAAAFVTGFFTLCLITKWGPWVTRYHLPLFVLSVPWMAAVLGYFKDNPLKGKRFLPVVFWGILFCLTAGWIFYRLYGSKLVQEVYEGKAYPFLNFFVEGQGTHGLDYYYSFAKFQMGVLTWLGVLTGVTCFLLFKSKKAIGNSLVLVLILGTFPYLFLGQQRPVIGKNNIFSIPRTDQYFAAHQEYQVPYQEIISRIYSEGCSDIGLVIGGERQEYLLWALGKKEDPKIRFEHLFVANESVIKARDLYRLCAIVSAPSLEIRQVQYRGQDFKESWRSNEINLYLPVKK